MSKPFLSSKRRFLYLLIIAVVLTTTFLSLGVDPGDIREKIREKTSEELMEQGRDYYRRNLVDSALLVFSYLGDNYDPRLPVEEKRISLRAKNNVGIIYAFEYMDYPRGYEALTEAFELAEDAGLEAPQMIMCHNIVELLRLYSVCLQSDNVDDRIEQYISIGVGKALEGKEYRGLASLIINAVHHNMGTPLEPLEKINSPEIPDTVEGVAYARDMIEAARLYGKGRYADARKKLEEAYPLRPTYSKPFYVVVGHQLAVADTYAAEGNTAMAESIALKTLALADSLNSMDSGLTALAFLAGLPVAGKDEYSRLLLEKKDAALSKGQLQMVSEIDFRRSLNREREENRRLSEQRTRLYRSLGIGTLLLIVFGILIGLLVRNSRKLKQSNASLYAKIQEQLATGMPPAPRPRGRTAPPDAEGADAADGSKYAGSSLSSEKMDEIQNRLTELLGDEATVCDSELSLAKTASRLNVNTTYLSRAVNERFGMSFSSLLSEYRVRIATQRISKGSSYANLTIEAIARSVGYSSRSSFIAAFKKINGMTPSEYMKLADNLSV